MRQPRRTFIGAFLHAMNRGYDGQPLFRDNRDRTYFLDLLKKIQRLTRIKIQTYCLMDNHYHMVVQDNGRMSDFFKQLNGQYAGYFRWRYKGRGYVFQDRFKSMLIQNDSYLKVAIAYVLNNPVRAGKVKHFSDYVWSSARMYFQKTDHIHFDTGFVEDIFGSKAEFISSVIRLASSSLPLVHTKLGLVIGSGATDTELEKKTERRRRPGNQNMECRRHGDGCHEPVTRIFQEFEEKYQLCIDDMDITTHAHKKLRGELLVLLKEKSGLSYREIAKLDIFQSLSINSLGTLYRRNRHRLKNCKG